MSHRSKGGPHALLAKYIVHLCASASEQHRRQCRKRAAVSLLDGSLGHGRTESGTAGEGSRGRIIGCFSAFAYAQAVKS